MEGLTPGRIVHYVLHEYDVPHPPEEAEHRPAIIVNVHDHETATVSLTFFLDVSRDTWDPTHTTRYRTYVEHDPEGRPGTWHWIEPA